MKNWPESTSLTTETIKIERKEINGVINKPYKYRLRYGIPLVKAQPIILYLFGLSKAEFSRYQKDFTISEEIAFKGNSNTKFRYFPTFSDSEKIDDLVPCDCLTLEGMKQLKKILWILKKTTPKLEFSPLLCHIITFLSMTFELPITFQIIKLLVNDSYKLLTESGQFNRAQELRGLRWHIHFNEDDFMKSCQAFLD